MPDGESYDTRPTDGDVSTHACPRLESLVSQASLAGIDYAFVSVNKSASSLNKMLDIMEQAYNTPLPGVTPMRVDFQRRDLDCSVKELASVMLACADGSSLFSSHTIGGHPVLKVAGSPTAATASGGGGGGGGGSGSIGGGASKSSLVGLTTASALLESLAPVVSRKLAKLGAIDAATSKPTGKPVKLSDADEDDLADSGLTLAHVRALKKFGVLL